MLKRISVPEPSVETLFGVHDENLKHFESLFNVRIRTQGHELMIDGEMQSDTAVTPHIIEETYPFSTLKGGAIVLIFPNRKVFGSTAAHKPAP